ncbi:MAG: hypothetical protein U0792_25765 [Gemmataceae bacterium]
MLFITISKYQYLNLLTNAASGSTIDESVRLSSRRPLEDPGR